MNYVGGGFLCVSNHIDSFTGKKYPIIILGKEAYGRHAKGKYADFGGGKEKKDKTIYHTILREVREELYVDLGSVDIVKSLPYIDLPIGKRGKKYKLCIGRIETILLRVPLNMYHVSTKKKAKVNIVPM